MKTKILIILGILIAITSCSENDRIAQNIDGNYVGTFEREEIITNVELNLKDNKFSGESDRKNFPAIYFGEFSVRKNELNFENKQPIITTEFDPNLILDGNWNYEFQDDQLTLTNSIGDIYILTKQ